MFSSNSNPSSHSWIKSFLSLIYCIFGIIKANQRNIWFNNRKIYFVGNKEITFFKNASSSSSQEIDASIWLVCEYVCYLKNIKCCGWLIWAYLEKRYNAGSNTISEILQDLQNCKQWRSNLSFLRKEVNCLIKYLRFEWILYTFILMSSNQIYATKMLLSCYGTKKCISRYIPILTLWNTTTSHLTRTTKKCPILIKPYKFRLFIKTV